MKADEKIKKKDYIHLRGPGNHVDLQVTFMDDMIEHFSSNNYHEAYDTSNQAMETVAKKAVERLVERQQHHRSAHIEEREALQALREFLGDKRYQDISCSFEESNNLNHKFLCTISHEFFPCQISGGWKRSKVEAKQSAAKIAYLRYCCHVD